MCTDFIYVLLIHRPTHTDANAQTGTQTAGTERKVGHTNQISLTAFVAWKGSHTLLTHANTHVVLTHKISIHTYTNIYFLNVSTFLLIYIIPNESAPDFEQDY